MATLKKVEAVSRRRKNRDTMKNVNRVEVIDQFNSNDDRNGNGINIEMTPSTTLPTTTTTTLQKSPSVILAEQNHQRPNQVEERNQFSIGDSDTEYRRSSQLYSIYRSISRCPRLLSLNQQSSFPSQNESTVESLIPFRTCSKKRRSPLLRTFLTFYVGTAAEYIFRMWECQLESSRLRSFINYLWTVCIRGRVTPLQLQLATFYACRLRQRYPLAAGQTGCSHRILIVSLLLAHHYFTSNSELRLLLLLSEDNDNPESLRCLHQTWSLISGIFTPASLHRMEVEFLGFLRADGLDVRMGDLEYFVGRVWEEGAAAIVPNSSNDWCLMGKKRRGSCSSNSSSFGGNTRNRQHSDCEDVAVVPSVQ